MVLFQTPAPKSPHKRAHFEQNAVSHRKRRSTIGHDLRMVDAYLPGPVPVAPSTPKKARKVDTPDRFIPVHSQTGLPLYTTPRTQRFARALGLQSDRQLPLAPLTAAPVLNHNMHNERRFLSSLLQPPSSVPTMNTDPLRLPPPELVLCAPDMVDDFYARLIAWSSRGLLALATPDEINAKNMHTGAVSHLFRLSRFFSSSVYAGNSLADNEPAQLEWAPPDAPNPEILAVGTEGGTIVLYDAVQEDRYAQWNFPFHEYGNTRGGRGLKEDGEYIGALSWSGNLLSAGYRCGDIRHYDVRMPHWAVALTSMTLSTGVGGKSLRVPDVHRHRVTGLQWSPDGRYLASGGGDEYVCVWDARATRRPLPLGASAEDGDGKGLERVRSKRLFRARLQKSTVKALAWCPWQPDVLATGGGTMDGSIRLWSIANRPLPASNSPFLTTGTSSTPPPLSTLSSNAYMPTFSASAPVSDESEGASEWGRPRYTRLANAQTHSQISALHFSSTTKELVSTHGFAWAPTRSPPTPTSRRRAGRSLAGTAARRGSLGTREDREGLRDAEAGAGAGAGGRLGQQVDGARTDRRHAILVHAFPSLRRVALSTDLNHGRISHAVVCPAPGQVSSSAPASASSGIPLFTDAVMPEWGRRSAAAGPNSGGDSDAAGRGCGSGYDRTVGRMVTCGADETVRVYRVFGIEKEIRERERERRESGSTGPDNHRPWVHRGEGAEGGLAEGGSMRAQSTIR